MSLRDWLHNAAIRGCVTALLVLASPAFSQTVSDDTVSQARTDKAKDQPRPDQSPLILESIQRAVERGATALESQTDQASAKKKEEREASDLDAQWVQAKWAKYVNWAAWTQAFFTFVGLVLILGTLKYTKDAAESARAMVVEGENATKAALEAAREAKRQADLAEKSFQTIQRPYVYVYGVTEIAPFDASKRLPYVVANHGQTPAIIRHAFAKLSTGDEPDRPWEIIEHHPLRVKPILDSREARRCFDEGYGLEDSGALMVVFQSDSGEVTSILPKIPAGKKLFFRVHIKYDGPGTHSPTGFRSFETSACWYYHPDINQFVLYGGDEYNYNR